MKTGAIIVDWSKKTLNTINLFTKTVFRGVGQIMLQENAFTGLLFLIGVFYGSFYMGLRMLFSIIIGSLTALILKYDRQETEKGLYGFSATLVGAVTFLFLELVFISWIIVILGSVCATLLQHFFIKRKIAAFTFPFVLVTWIIILGIKN